MQDRQFAQCSLHSPLVVCAISPITHIAVMTIDLLMLLSSPSDQFRCRLDSCIVPPSVPQHLY